VPTAGDVRFGHTVLGASPTPVSSGTRLRTERNRPASGLAH